MSNEEEIVNLIYFLFNSLKEKNVTNMNKAVEILNQLCSSEQNSYLIGNVLGNIIFNPSTEYDLRMLSAIILYRFKILKDQSIVNHYIIQLCQTIISDESYNLVKLICSTVGSAIIPSQIEILLNHQPNHQILFILYYYIQNKAEENINSNGIYNYIVKNSLFDPTTNNIEIATISIGILSSLHNDDTYKQMILNLFLQIPAIPKYLPFFCELISQFDDIPDCNEKMEICFTKLDQLSKIESFPFEKKNILDHDISVELMVDCFIEYINYYIDDENINYEVDSGKVFKFAVIFCMIQDYVKERWMVDIDSFLIENQCNPDENPSINYENGYVDDESEHDLIRCHTLSLIHESIPFNIFYHNLIQLIIGYASSNPILASKMEEVLYYVIFSYIKMMEFEENFEIIPPINQNDILLYGEYIRCLTALGKPLSDAEYSIILNPNSHFILKISLAQGLAVSESTNFPNNLILRCIECLISMIDLFQTNADIDFFELIGSLVLKAEMEIEEYTQIALLIRDQCIKYMNNSNRIENLYSIISDFLNRPSSIPIILDIFLPVLHQSIRNNDLQKQCILLLQVMTKKLPCIDNSIQISENNLKVFSDIYYQFIIPLISYILNGGDDFDFHPESIFSILAFYCRIEMANPLFYQLILFAIDKLKENSMNSFRFLRKNFVSFVYEYLIANSNQNIGKAEIIQKIIEYFSIPPNKNKYIRDNENLLLIISALFCTKVPEYALPLLISIPNFCEAIFSFAINHFAEFTTEERYIYAIMYFLFVKHAPQLYNNDTLILINDIIASKSFEIDTCNLLDKDDPFISGHYLVNISKDTFFDCYQQLLSQLNIKS